MIVNKVDRKPNQITNPRTMSTVSKPYTAVQVLQELIAIHTIRVEAGERLQGIAPSPAFTSKLVAATQQSKGYISDLMEELSKFGDGVPADVDRDNPYHTLWVDELTHLDTMDSQDAEKLFTRMESSLPPLYSNYNASQSELPAAISSMLSHQSGELLSQDAVTQEQ